MTDDADLTWLEDLVKQVILDAVDRKADAVCDHLETIGLRGGHVGMFSACWAWATAAGTLCGLAAEVKSGRADGVGMVPLTGHPIDETAPGTFAARMLTCAINGDIDTAHALFDTSWRSGDETRHHLDVLAVVAMVGDLGRIKQADVARERRQARTRRARRRPRR